MNFKDSYGKNISLKDIVGLINSDHEYEIYVGSDSQLYKPIKKVIYATCIVLYRKGKGGRFFVACESERCSNSLKERLMNEVFRSLQVSFELKNMLPSNVELTVHVDVNPKKKFKSGQYTQELVSMIVSQGFKVEIKPYAFAAQSVSNRYTK